MKQRGKIEEKEEPPEVILFQVSATPTGLQVRGTTHLHTTQKLALAEVLRLAAEGVHADLLDEFLGGGQDE